MMHKKGLRAKKEKEFQRKARKITLATLVFSAAVGLGVPYFFKTEPTPEGTPTQQAEYYLENEKPSKAIEILEQQRYNFKKINPDYKGTVKDNFLEIIARTNNIGKLEAALNTEGYQKQVNLITQRFGDVATHFEEYPKETIYLTRWEMKHNFKSRSYEEFKKRLDTACEASNDARAGRFLCSMVEGDWEQAINDSDFAVQLIVREKFEKTAIYEKNLDEELCQYAFEQMTELELYAEHSKERKDEVAHKILSEGQKEYSADYQGLMQVLRKFNPDRYKARKQNEENIRAEIFKKHEEHKRQPLYYAEVYNTKIQELRRN
jgi:hypothetical protein